MPHYDSSVLANAVQAAFIVSVVVAAASLALAVTGRATTRPLALTALVFLAVAAAGWIAFAFRPERELAMAATGLLAAALAQAAAAALARSLRRGQEADEVLEGVRSHVRAVIEEEKAATAEEVQRWLARTRADSISVLADEERRLAEERRVALVERERRAGEELVQALAVVERRVEERLRTWSDDVDRAQHGLSGEVAQLEQRQRQLLAEAEARIADGAAELVTGAEEQRASVLRLRAELEQSAQAAVAEALDELEAHTSERRRVVEEVSERLRRREHALSEQIERSEGEAVARIEASFGDVERRQVEKLQRVVAREGERYAEAAAQQFDVTLRAARDEAAGRLSRELDRGVENFMRQAEAVYAERLSHTGDLGQQRLEARIRQTQTQFERQHELLAESAEHRIAQADAELRRVLGSVVAEAEAERAALEARLEEIARRLDDVHASFRPR